MARRKKNRKPNNKPAVKRAAPTSIPPESPSDKLARIEQAAMSHATDEDIEAMTAAAAPAPSNDITSVDIIERASKMLALVESQRQRIEKREAELDDREKKLEQESARLEAQRKKLADREKECSEREEKIKATEADLLRREEEITQRELDADAGFIRRNREALNPLVAEGKALRTQYSSLQTKMEEERAAFEKELQEKRAKFDEEIASQREALEKERADLAEEAKQLRKRSRELELDRELFEEDREAFEERVEQRAARLVEQKDGEIRSLEERLEAARKERDQLALRLAEREEAERQFGGETPEEVMRRLQTLEKEREQLRKELGARPSTKAMQQLKELERQREQWESERIELLAELGETRQDAARKRIAVTELESLRDEKRSLESANALLEQNNEQLRTTMDNLVKGVEGNSPFPSCSAMDADNDLQTSRPTTDRIKSLSDFAEYVRHRMARDPMTGKELYYSAEDVRSFLGGLAMSRLHLLQGISGTGKTSLPLAFTRAIGAGNAVIEVQAGWRDRQDLIGHFNTFERRFYESEFLQALYRAQTPLYRDTPFLIVLDEMNLSHPEQYFADLLSALEQDQHHQRLVLMTAAVDQAPQLLDEGGTKIKIPPNVWFIGTANHDETTVDFADKTYDRAHVMELPRHRESFKPTDYLPQDPVSLEALQNAFDEAVEAHETEATEAYSFLQDDLGEILERRFRIGWGNRLERQMDQYVPVVIAAGGTLGEATDHILATKLLRKIRDRYDNRPEDIIALRDQIQGNWGLLDETHEPKRSLNLLKEELHRLGSDDA